MSRKRFWTLFAVLFGVSGLFELFLGPASHDIFSLLGRTIGTTIGALIPGLLLYGGFRLFRTPENAPSARRLALWGALLFLPLSMCRYAAPSQNSSEELSTIRKQIRRGCMSKLEQNAGNVSVSQKQMRTYCTCVSDSVSIQLTKREVNRVYEKGKLTESVRLKTKQASNDCQSSLLDESSSRS